MNLSRPFIERPVATTLLGLGILLIGIIGYLHLPVSSLPNVEMPVVRVSVTRPGASPDTMAKTVAAPLERRIGEIAGVNELTSVNSQGSTAIMVQFDFSRSVDAAARDVQAAINAATVDLPTDLATRPTYRKFNPSAIPILIIALTSDTLSLGQIYDAADSILAQRIAQVEGVADVNVGGAQQPAIRFSTDAARLASMGLGLDQVRTAVVGASVLNPLGSFDGPATSSVLLDNDQLSNQKDYHQIVVKTANGMVTSLGDIAHIRQGVVSDLAAGWFNRRPAVLLTIRKTSDANVIETVDRIRQLLPVAEHWMPAGIKISISSDLTGTIRESIGHLKITMGLTILMVMLVVFLFLRRLAPLLAAGITVPLSLSGTLAAMWWSGFSFDNLSLMALTISVGFIVDDAIVMIENAYRNLEKGLDPIAAALEGSRQIGFTVLSISLSLVAVFIPLLFLGGIIGRFFIEFAATVTYTIVISAVISLTVTPMVCSRFMRREKEGSKTRLDRWVEHGLEALIAGYLKSLSWVLGHRWLMLVATLLCVIGTVWLYAIVPKDLFPPDDTGLINAQTETASDSSFQQLATLQQRAADIILADPAVQSVASTIGGNNGPQSGALNQGQIFVALKPLSVRKASAEDVVNRLRPKLAHLTGLSVFLSPVQDLRFGARQGKSDYQFTMWDPDMDELLHWVPLVVQKIKALPGFVDISTDHEKAGPQLNVVIDRLAAARLGVSVAAIDAALGDSFAQRQIVTIYQIRNQYRVVQDVPPGQRQDPSALDNIYVSADNGTQVPLRAVARIERGLAPLVVNHQGQFPAITIGYSLTQGMAMDVAARQMTQAIADLHPPDTIHADFAGNAALFLASLQDEPLLILAALLCIYIILGVLYEDLLHPLTILSTLPSAGLGALLALLATGTELTIIAIIGIILLMGIVKKNGILLVDFAIDAERSRGVGPKEAILEAAAARFRPIIMTTMTAMLGAVPLVLVTGAGGDLRRPLGIAVIGGLLVSQALTLYTTPVIYLLLDGLRGRRRHAAGTLREGTAI